MIRILCLALALALLLSPALAADQPPAEKLEAETAPGVTDSRIRLGTWAPMSGDAAPWGAMARGTDVYFQWLNQKGGIHGRQLKLLMFDDRNDPAVTKAGVKKLTEELGVFAFVGGVGAQNCLAVMDYLVERGLPWVGMACGAKLFSHPPKKSIFAVRPTYIDEAALLVKYTVEVLEKKRIAFIYESDVFGLEGLDGVSRQLLGYNLKLAVPIPVQPGQMDLSSQLAELKRAAPEAVLMFLTPVHAVILRRLAAAQGFEPIWITGSALADAAVMDKLTGGLWAGTIFSSLSELPNSHSSLMTQYRQAFDKYAAPGERWGEFFYSGFGFAEPLVEGLRRCGRDLSRERFITEMENLRQFKGVLGHINYGPGQRQGQKELFLAQALKNGQVRQLSDWFIIE